MAPYHSGQWRRLFSQGMGSRVKRPLLNNISQTATDARNSLRSEDLNKFSPEQHIGTPSGPQMSYQHSESEKGSLHGVPPRARFCRGVRRGVGSRRELDAHDATEPGKHTKHVPESRHKNTGIVFEKESDPAAELKARPACSNFPSRVPKKARPFYNRYINHQWDPPKDLLESVPELLFPSLDLGSLDKSLLKDLRSDPLAVLQGRSHPDLKYIHMCLALINARLQQESSSREAERQWYAQHKPGSKALHLLLKIEAFNEDGVAEESDEILRNLAHCLAGEDGFVAIWDWVSGSSFKPMYSESEDECVTNMWQARALRYFVESIVYFAPSYDSSNAAMRFLLECKQNIEQHQKYTGPKNLLPPYTLLLNPTESFTTRFLIQSYAEHADPKLLNLYFDFVHTRLSSWKSRIKHEMLRLFCSTVPVWKKPDAVLKSIIAPPGTHFRESEASSSRDSKTLDQEFTKTVFDLFVITAQKLHHSDRVVEAYNVLRMGRLCYPYLFTVEGWTPIRRVESSKRQNRPVRRRICS